MLNTELIKLKNDIIASIEDRKAERIMLSNELNKLVDIIGAVDDNIKELETDKNTLNLLMDILSIEGE